MSWRDSEDPRCPECGEEISASATYCMHCYADLPADGQNEDVSSGDDVGFGADENDGGLSADESVGSEASSVGGGETADGASGDADRSSVYGSGESTADADPTGTASAATGQTTTDSDHPTANSASSSGESGTFSSVPSPHSLDGIAGDVASLLWTDVPDPQGVPDETFTAPLWMRVPVGFFSGLFVFFAFVGWWGFLTAGVSVPGGGVVLLVGFFAIVFWLVRKPLPSDILGDACYGIAILILLMPIAYLLNAIGGIAVGGETSLQTVGVFTVVGLLVAIIPAVLFMVVGYVGNKYARSKLDSKAEQSTGPAEV